MKDKNSSYEQDIVKALETVLLSEKELQICEGFLYGEKEIEALAEIQVRDVSLINDEKIHSMFYILRSKKEKVLLDKLFHIVFAIGGVTGHKMLPYGLDEEITGTQEDEMAKKVAMQSEAVASISDARFYSVHLCHMQKFVRYSPQKIQEALAYQHHVKGRIILLATYFLLKYEDRTENSIQVEQEDRLILEEYESLLTAYNEADVLEFQTVFSYLNYMLSEKIENVLRTCLATDVKKSMELIIKAGIDTKMDITYTNERLEKQFQVPMEMFIRLVAAYGERRRDILEVFLRRSPDSFLQVLDSSSIEITNLLYDILQKCNQELYQKVIEQKKESGLEAERERLAEYLINNDQNKIIILQYLCGRISTKELLEAESTIVAEYIPAQKGNMVRAYYAQYKDKEYYRRYQVVMLLTSNSSELYREMIENSSVKEAKIKALFEIFEKEGLDTLHQLRCVELVYEYIPTEQREIFVTVAADIFEWYLSNRKEEVLQAFAKAEKFAKIVILKVLGKYSEEYKKEILSCAKEANKIVQEVLIDMLTEYTNWENEIKELLSAKKASEREVAVKILIRWQEKNPVYQEVLQDALEEEKNAKVKKLLEEELVKIGQKAFDAGSLSIDDLVKELHKGNKKHNLSWAYETPFSVVHTTSGEEVDEEYLQAILLSYDSMKEYGISKNAELLAETLNKKDFSVYVNELFDKWMEKGAEAKKRWVLYVSAIHGGADILEKLKYQIQEWAMQSRGAIAAEAVQAVVLNPMPDALLFVDSLSRKFKNKQVKNAAGKALEFAAAQLEISKEELADRIVPDFGFDDKMQRVFDYGERTFTVTLTTALEMEVFDESGKKLKSIPAPGKKDNEVKAAEAYNEFKLLKKQMKTTISNQKERLEIAFSTERDWEVSAWKALFVKNPIMHQFAIGLIWGIYEDKKLVQSFRYMEDGSFNTVDEEECEIPDNAKIGLVHPIELSDKEKEAWKQQLVDYEMVQPIVQLDREIFYMTEEEAECKHFERFGGCIVSGLSLGGKLLGLGWYKGSVQDAGIFYTYYREDAELGLGVELHFSGSCVEFGYGDDEVTVYDARFFKAGSVARGSYCYDEADEKKAYLLKDIPARYFSEIVLQLTKATATNIKRDEDWKKEAY